METFIEDYVKGNRLASIYKDNYGYYVQLSEVGSRLVVTRDLRNHTLEYAQCCAENWVEGVIP